MFPCLLLSGLNFGCPDQNYTLLQFGLAYSPTLNRFSMYFTPKERISVMLK